jgi:hypothetical protein
VLECNKLDRNKKMDNKLLVFGHSMVLETNTAQMTDPHIMQTLAWLAWICFDENNNAVPHGNDNYDNCSGNPLLLTIINGKPIFHLIAQHDPPGLKNRKLVKQVKSSNAVSVIRTMQSIALG